MIELQTGFSFNGVHCSEYGIAFCTVNRPVIPEMKQYSIDPPGMDGAVDFSEAMGRAFYRDVVFEMGIYLESGDIYETQRKLSAIASWLIGTGKLSFDDLPGVYWVGRLVTPLGVALKVFGRVVQTNIMFQCKPFSYGLKTENVNLSQGNSVVRNIGTWHSRPIFTCTGASSGIVITANGNALSFTGAFSNLVIDCEEHEVTDSGVSVIRNSSGDFPELKPGDNNLHIAVSGGSPSLKLSYTPRYIYGVVS